MELEDIISSPIEAHDLEDALPPLVASPSVSEITTSFDEPFPLLEEWDSRKEKRQTSLLSEKEPEKTEDEPQGRAEYRRRANQPNRISKRSSGNDSHIHHLLQRWQPAKESVCANSFSER